MRNVFIIFLFNGALACLNPKSGVSECTGLQTTIWLYSNGHCQDPEFCSCFQNCTTWYGNLIIKSTMSTVYKTTVPHFPKLREITGYLVISVFKLDVFNLLPSLAVIRGENLVVNYALVVYFNEMKELFFPSLTTILHGGVRIARNHRLCYANTIRWESIVKDKDQRGDYGIVLSSNKLNCNSGCVTGQCYVAPGHGNNPKAQYCWGPGNNNNFQCQRFCTELCELEGCVDGTNGVCCHGSCLGGCSAANSSTKCHACKHYRMKGTGECVKQCPANYYLVNNLLCQKACPGWNLTNSTDNLMYYSLNGRCLLTCPSGYSASDKLRLCVKCKADNCTKTCRLDLEKVFEMSYKGAIIRVPADIKNKNIYGCTTIIGSLTFQLEEGTGNVDEYFQGLRWLKVVRGHINIHKSSIRTLDFLSNLEVIKPPESALLHNKYALAVYENSFLEELWTPKSKLRIKRGKVFFQLNPRLCPQKIFSLADKMQYQNGSEIVGDISKDKNGYRVNCKVSRLNLVVEEFRLTGFSFDSLDQEKIACLDVKCAKVYWNFTRDARSYKILFYSIYYKKLNDGEQLVLSHRDWEGNWQAVTVDKPNFFDTKTQLQSKVITKLEPYSRYAFFIKEVVSVGEERVSEIKYVNISQDVPSAPLGVEASFMSESAIQLRWREPDKPNGKIIAYKIYWRKTDYSFWHEQQTLDWCKRNTITDIKPRPLKKAQGVCDVEASCICEAEKEKSIAVKADRNAHKFMTEFQDRINQVIFTKQRNRNNQETDDNLLEYMSSQILFNVTKNLKKPLKLRTTLPPKIESRTPKVVSGDTYTYIVNGLHYFQDYEFQVCACTDTTMAGGCAMPQSNLNLECGSAQARTGINATADNLKKTSLKIRVSGQTWNISWSPPLHPNAVVLKYDVWIRYQSGGDHISLCRPAHLPTHVSQASTVAGDFVARVRAISPAGNGSWSNEVHFTINEVSTKKPTAKLVVGVIAGAGALIFVLLAFIVYYVVFHRQNDKGLPGVLYASVNPEYMNSNEVYIPDEWELEREHIELVRELGQGSFGMVFEGIVSEQGQDLRVAVKTVNKNASLHERKQFLQEASMMKAFDCNHVVKLIGVVSQGQPTFVVMELMGRGDLKSFLRSRRPGEGSHLLPPMQQEMYQMVAEIADGMAYLAARKFVHRDLAARNCMVAVDFTVKIGDFGMTRDIYETNYYRKGGKGLLPVRWMAPESLKDGIFTAASDVWSFGVVLWEICTLAAQPYQGKSNEQVLNFVINHGQLDYPDDCDKKLKEFMALCWQRDSKQRPSFLEIVRLLEDEVNEDFAELSFYHKMKRKALEEAFNDNTYEMLARDDIKMKDYGSLSSVDSGAFEKLDSDYTPEMSGRTERWRAGHSPSNSETLLEERSPNKRFHRRPVPV